MTGPGGFDLAVSSEMVFLDLPHLDRVRRIDELGFAVEIWDWTTKDVPALAATGATFSSMTGYVTGRLADAGGADELVRTAELSVRVAHELGCPRLNLHGTGLDRQGLPLLPAGEVTGAMWVQAVRTLERIAALGAREGLVFCLENLNTAVDHPGVPFARLADVTALVAAVGSPHLRVMLDVYHAQIGEGDLVSAIRRAAHLIGEVQVADVPGRCEPGTGEIHYPAIARALADVGYRGTVGLEAWASSGSELALERFRAAFTLPDPVDLPSTGAPPSARALTGRPA